MSERAGVRVVGLGQACVDYLGRVPVYPSEDTKVEMADLQVQCGGPASTALVALARLGVSTAFLGSIASDAFGALIRNDLMAEGVDLTGLRIHPDGTSQFAFIAVSKGGRSTDGLLASRDRSTPDPAERGSLLVPGRTGPSCGRSHDRGQPGGSGAGPQGRACGWSWTEGRFGREHRLFSATWTCSSLPPPLPIP